MLAGVVIELWKLPVFLKHLEAEGFEYTQHRSESAIMPGDVMVLKVKTEDPAKLESTIRAAQAECARSKLD